MPSDSPFFLAEGKGRHTGSMQIFVKTTAGKNIMD